MDNRGDFQTLINGLMAVIEANAHRKTDAGKEHQAHAQILSIKLFRHLISMNTIADGCAIEQGNQLRAAFCDFSSVDVLLRAAIETHLVFHYLFSSEDAGLSSFRYLAWRYAGLKERLKLIPTTDEGREKALSTQAQFDVLKVEMQASPYYQSLGKHRRDHLTGGKWAGGLHWQHLADQAGFHSSYFRNIYTYVCSHAHSDFISVIQITDAQDPGDQLNLALSAFSSANMVLAHHIRLFIRLFPETGSIYLANAGAVSVVDKWFIRAEDMEPIYPPTGSKP